MTKVKPVMSVRGDWMSWCRKQEWQWCKEEVLSGSIKSWTVTQEAFWRTRIDDICRPHWRHIYSPKGNKKVEHYQVTPLEIDCGCKGLSGQRKSKISSNCEAKQVGEKGKWPLGQQCSIAVFKAEGLYDWVHENRLIKINDKLMSISTLEIEFSVMGHPHAMCLHYLYFLYACTPVLTWVPCSCMSASSPSDFSIKVKTCQGLWV